MKTKTKTKSKPKSSEKSKSTSAPSSKDKSVRRHRTGPVNKALRALCRRISHSSHPSLTKALLSQRIVNRYSSASRRRFTVSLNLDPGFSPEAGVFTS